MTYDYHGVSFLLLQRRFFPVTEGGRVSCVVRIGQLVKAGYLVTRRLPSSSGVGGGKLLITLGPAGRALVAKQLGLTPGQLRKECRADSVWFVPHKFAVGEVRLSFELAAERSQAFQVLAWTPDEELQHQRLHVPDPRRPGRTLTLVPDSAFTLGLPSGASQAFYLEVDRGTVPAKSVRQKLAAYLLRPATPVLWVAPTPPRARAIASWAVYEAHQLGRDPTIVWVTTSDALTENTVFHHAIWQIAGGPEQVSLQALATRSAALPVARPAPRTVSVQGVLPL